MNNYKCIKSAEILKRINVNKGDKVQAKVSPTGSMMLFRDNSFIGFGNIKWFKEI